MEETKQVAVSHMQSGNVDYEDREDPMEMPPASSPSFAIRHEAAKQISALLGSNENPTHKGLVQASEFESIEVRHQHILP